MNKILLFAATVAAMLASCSSDDLSLTSSTSSKQLLTDEYGNPGCFFDGNSQRSLTRAGYAGVMDNDQLKTNGFGVFGYYTNLNEYDQLSKPNFMYNEKVVYSGGSWTYSPIKYWPNEYGSKAQSDDVDKLTFFAYAPFTANTPATGKVAEDKVGITGFTRHNATGDPYVKYVGSLDPTQCVDLCWGVADPSADVEWKTIQGGSQPISKGMPWINVQRPEKSLGQKMKFFFKHALAQLNVQIDADVNTNTHGAGAEVDAKSKVYVRSITFNGFAMKGALNLNNDAANTPNWKGYNCSNEPIVAEEYTIYDGMKDGQEGTGYKASNEKVTGLNPTIIQTKKWSEQAATDGVQKAAKNLFNNTDATAPIYVIPTGDNMSVTIVYDIETKDDNLAGTVSDNETNGVSIKSEISKTITLTSGDALKLEAGKKYTIQLHLGLSQVEFDAVVSDWDDSAAAGEAWLPENGAPGPNSISISGADALAANNYAGQLTATVTPAEVDQTVTWSSSKPELLAVDANTGEVTLAGGIPLAGEDVTITATSNADNSVKDTKTITVKPALGMFIASDGKAYLSAAAATTAGTTAKAWIAAEGLAIALNADATLGNNDISWNDFKSQTSNFTTGPAEANISGGSWRWPNKADLDAIDASINAGNYQGCPLESGYGFWSTEVYDSSDAWYLAFFGNGSYVSYNYMYVSDSLRVRAVFAY